jgi:aspartyl-tRNA(Asn)/glutamyl-tRNA(Gln) amidotransferase subunit C
MSLLNRDELRKIAQLSSLELTDAELDALLPDIKKLLDYTGELANVSLGDEQLPARNVNLLREDVARPAREQAILSQAPKTDGTYFVVPKILD